MFHFGPVLDNNLYPNPLVEQFLLYEQQLISEVFVSASDIEDGGCSSDGADMK